MKKVISLFLSFLLIANIAPCIVSAESENIGGTWGTLSWVLDAEGTLTISGKGSMKEINPYCDEAWSLYNNDIKTVVIENGVTSVGINAFYRCYNLTDVTLADSVASIGKEAFSCCSK